MKTHHITTLIICATILSGSCLSIKSQTNDEINKLKIGGISINIEKQDVLEEANIGVYYQYSYMIKNEGNSVKNVDTLFLVSGTSQSVYLDPIYKDQLEIQRLARIARSKKAKLINPEYENLNDISDLIKINSDFKEDNPGDPVQIYKNRNTGTVTSIYNSYLINIRCDQEIEQMTKWQIIGETDTIIGHVCQKALITYAGRNYRAWFTLDIPINDGPWKFWGLPGLILKVTDDQELFEWVGIGIKNLNADIVIDKKNYDKATVIQFRDYIERATSTVMVSFYNNNVLYFTNKKLSYTKLPIELSEK